MNLGRVVLVIGIAIALVGSGIGYLMAESERQYQGWVKIELKNVGTKEMTVGLMVIGIPPGPKAFSAAVVVLSANESSIFGLAVQWHQNSSFYVSALYGNNATPDYNQSQIISKMVKCTRGDVVNVTLSLDMALVRSSK